MLAKWKLAPPLVQRWLQRRREKPNLLEAKQNTKVPRPGRLIIGALVGIASCGFSLLPIGRSLENKGYDLLFLLRGPLPRVEDIVIVTVDDASFSELRLQWPWPRSLHGQLIDRLRGAGAKVIGFDILFDQPSASAKEDAALAKAIARAGNVMLAADRAEVATPTTLRVIFMDPLSPLASGAAGVGLASQLIDPDRIIRRARPAVDGKPTLAAALARYVGASVPEPGSEFFINYPGPKPAFTSVSYSAALSRTAVPDGFLKNKIILVGRSQGAAGKPTDDRHFTPFSVTGGETPGVEIHAAALDTLLRRRPIRPLPQSVNLFFNLAWCIGASLLLGRLLPWSGLVALFGLAAACLTVALTLFIDKELWVAWLSPVFGMAALYVILLGGRWLSTELERRKVEKAIKHYLHPDVVEQLLRDPQKLEPGGASIQNVNATVLFSDLEGFTGIAETMTPRELVDFLIEYLSAMTGAILNERGMVNRTFGDGILALWGAPIETTDHALAACRAALAMQQRVAQLNGQRAARGLRPLRMRIGIQTGEIVVGNVGSKDHFEYALVGDNVNLASRLESIDKLYQVGIIIGAETAQRVAGSIELRELDSIRVVGRSQPQVIFQCVDTGGGLSASQRQAFAEFQAGLQLYRQRNWSKAGEYFSRALISAPGDGPSIVYLKRCEEFLAYPPAPDWDGVYIAEGKQG